ncbi:hypothetical protein A6U92_03245 [Agrobacterium rubi]|nr:hypothetical protein A6U92_03245 [Agrobacterium rubi]
MDDGQKTVMTNADDPPPHFTVVDRSIFHIERKGIVEYGAGIGETDAVLCKIGNLFLLIPFEI